MKIFFSFVLGVLTFLTILLINYVDRMHEQFLIIYMMIAIVLLYAATAMIIWSLDYLFFFLFGMSVIRGLLLILLPVLNIILVIWNHHQKAKQVKTTAVTEQGLIFRSDSADCLQVRYGTFCNEIDTITRIKTDSGDYEILKRGDYYHTSRIKWFNECNYSIIPLEKGKKRVYAKIGNVTADSCMIYYWDLSLINNSEDFELKRLKRIKPAL